MIRKFRTSKTALAVALLLLALAPIALGLPSVVTSTTCVAAGGTGLTAYMVATSHQTLSGNNINAAGCDIGIYIGPGTNHVKIVGVTVTGAHDHAIFAQDASQITIENSFVTGNGVSSHVCPTPTSPPPCIAEDKPIQFAGVTDSVIRDNVVTNNHGDGGIGVADDGPASVGGDPGALTASATASTPSSDDTVSGNTIADNDNGCGIVVAGYDANVGVNHIKVDHNIVVGAAPPGPYKGPGSFYGQIVVAGDGPFSPVSDVQVVDNAIYGSLLPGIVLHANVFGDTIDETQIKGNIIADNGYYPTFFEMFPDGLSANAPLACGTAPCGTTGISVVAEVGVWTPACPTCTPDPVISHTTITSNTIYSDANGVWLCGTHHTEIHNLKGNPTNPTVTCAAGGS